MLWPFVYGTVVFSTNNSLTVPDTTYLYLMKPLMLLLTLIAYGFFILTTTAVIDRTFDFLEVSLTLLSLILVVILSYTDIYKFLGLLDTNNVNVNDPVSCFYFSVVTYTTLGYGDLRPSPSARLFAASEAFLGYILFSLFIGVILQSIYKLQDAKRQRTNTT